MADVQSLQTFEEYVQLQASAAAIVRAACEGREELLARIAELESELQVVSSRGAAAGALLCRRAVASVD